jgi:hypothetical protein
MGISMGSECLRVNLVYFMFEHLGMHFQVLVYLIKCEGERIFDARFRRNLPHGPGNKVWILLRNVSIVA